MVISVIGAGISGIGVAARRAISTALILVHTLPFD
jgi:ribosomal protein S9